MDRSKQMGEKSIPRLLVSFSLPAIVGMTVQASYSVIDRIFVGNGVGSLGIAGIAVGLPMLMIMIAFYVLVGIGSAALISIKLGQGKKEEAQRIVGNGFAAITIVSIIITIFGLIYLDPLLVLFGASKSVLPYARDYMQVMLVFTLFGGIGFSGNNFIRAEGNPKTAMGTMLIGAGINAALAPIFIFHCKWGMYGAAMAAAIAQTVSMIWVMAYYASGKSLLKPGLADFRPNLSVILPMFAIGSSPFTMNVAACVLTIVLNNTLKIYGGDIAISAMGIVMPIMMMVLMPILGINQGAQPIIGYNYGAGNPKRVRAALVMSIAAATAIATIGCLIAVLAPTQLVSMFSKNDPALTKLAAHALTIFFACLPLAGFQVVSAAYFQAVGRPLEAMILSLSRQVILLIPAAIILPRFLGLDGIFIAGPFSDAVSAIITGTWLLLELKRLKPAGAAAVS